MNIKKKIKTKIFALCSTHSLTQRTGGAQETFRPTVSFIQKVTRLTRSPLTALRLPPTRKASASAHFAQTCARQLGLYKLPSFIKQKCLLYLHSPQTNLACSCLAESNGALPHAQADVTPPERSYSKTRFLIVIRHADTSYLA